MMKNNVDHLSPIDSMKDLFFLNELDGSVKQRLAISSGMTTGEEAILQTLEKSNDFGEAVLNGKGKRKYSLRINNPSRKKSTYDVDGMFYDSESNTVTLVDVKPATHDNSTPANNHVEKFKDAFDTYVQDNPDKNVRFVIAVGGNATYNSINKSTYYTAFKNEGIGVISMKDEYGFDVDKIKYDFFVENYLKFLERAHRDGHGTPAIYQLLRKTFINLS